jgi:predicted amidohydrolase
MARFLGVAMVQLASDVESPDLEARKAEQLAKIDRYLDTIVAIDPVVDLFVFPETCVSGFDPANWESLAETIPGPSSDHFCRKARELGKWICPGSLIEKREGVEGTHNTSLLISPTGDIVLKYCKVFVPYPFDPSLRGDDFPVYEIPGVGKIGIMIWRLTAPRSSLTLCARASSSAVSVTWSRSPRCGPPRTSVTS